MAFSVSLAPLLTSMGSLGRCKRLRISSTILSFFFLPSKSNVPEIWFAILVQGMFNVIGLHVTIQVVISKSLFIDYGCVFSLGGYLLINTGDPVHFAHSISHNTIFFFSSGDEDSSTKPESKDDKGGCAIKYY